MQGNSISNCVLLKFVISIRGGHSKHLLRTPKRTCYATDINVSSACIVVLFLTKFDGSQSQKKKTERVKKSNVVERLHVSEKSGENRKKKH